MRRPALLVLLVAMLAVFAMAVGAYADGPGGSTEHHSACIDETTGEEVPANPDGSCPEGSAPATVYDNDVTCGSDDDAAGLDVSGSSGGLEVCNDDSDLPVQGRVMAAGDPASQSGFVGADGDVDNSPEQAQGWIGLSSEAGTPLACGDTDGNRDLSHATAADDINDCMP